jgi:superfamily II DNA helicase RecQ
MTGEPYQHPRMSNTRPGERLALNGPEHLAYSVGTVECSKSLIKLQKLVEDFQKYEGADRKPDLENALIAKVICTVWGYQPWEIQAEVLQWLVFRREDCILTVKTSMGKSLPLQAILVLVPNSVAIIILPLNKIGQEQVEKLRNLGSKLGGNLVRPIFVNAESKAVNPKLFDDIMMLKYTHVFIGPEQAVSAEFGDILKEPSFKTKVSLIAIDEAYLVGK